MLLVELGWAVILGTKEEKKREGVRDVKDLLTTVVTKVYWARKDQGHGKMEGKNSFLVCFSYWCCKYVSK